MTARSTPLPRRGNRFRIVLLDDDEEFCRALAGFLEAHDCEVHPVHRAEELEEVMRREKPDLLLLDQCLGGITGTEVLRRIRRSSGVPCIIVTGMSNPRERILNLEIGADDQVDKSASPRELLARIRAVSRRAERMLGPLIAQAAGRWHLDLQRRELRRPNGAICHLTGSEYELLRLLCENKRQPVSRETLTQGVFARPFTIFDRAVDTLVLKLRAKIDVPGQPTTIKSIRGVGYTFVGFPDERGEG